MESASYGLVSGCRDCDEARATGKGRGFPIFLIEKCSQTIRIAPVLPNGSLRARMESENTLEAWRDRANA